MVFTFFGEIDKPFIVDARKLPSEECVNRKPLSLIIKQVNGQFEDISSRTLNAWQTTKEPWSSGYGRRLMFQRS